MDRQIVACSNLSWNRDRRDKSLTELRCIACEPIKSYSEIFDFSSLQHQYWKKTHFLAVFIVFASLLLASNVQRWIRDVQKCSSLNQLWPEMSKLKSAGSALNIAENAKISESALKMTECLWELNRGTPKISPDLILFTNEAKGSPVEVSHELKAKIIKTKTFSN